jgi:hypothetical protein
MGFDCFVRTLTGLIGSDVRFRFIEVFLGLRNLLLIFY